MTSSTDTVPQAEIVHDKFHINKHLKDEVDKLRRQENKRLRGEGDDRPKGKRQLWLYNKENLDTERYQGELSALLHLCVRVFRGVFFDRWYRSAIRSRLEPIKKVARKLKEHLDGILSYFRHGITNAITEGFISRIQSIKSAARGFRNFVNCRLAGRSSDSAEIVVAIPAKAVLR